MERFSTPPGKRKETEEREAADENRSVEGEGECGEGVVEMDYETGRPANVSGRSYGGGSEQ